MTSLPCRPSAPLVTDRDVLALFEDGTPLRLEFQPQYDLRNGRLSSAEALARWSHPEKGDVPPADFMPAIHRLGLEQAFFERVCSLALDAIRVLNCHGIFIPIAINACARTLAGPRSLAFLRREALRRRIPPSHIRIELTEEMAMEGRPGLCEAMARLRAWGCEVALDDFGSGYSNLAMLARLDIDELKLDRQLVARVDDSLVAREAVRFALALGERMGWRVVAEGISTSAELRALQALGCGHGQGYLLGRPMPLSRLAALADAGAGSAMPVSCAQCRRLEPGRPCVAGY